MLYFIYLNDRFGNIDRVRLIFTDEGGLEVCGDGDRSAAALHLLHRDNCWYHRDPDGRSSHFRVRGPGSYHRDISWEIIPRELSELQVARHPRDDFR